MWLVHGKSPFRSCFKCILRLTLLDLRIMSLGSHSWISQNQCVQYVHAGCISSNLICINIFAVLQFTYQHCLYCLGMCFFFLEMYLNCFLEIYLIFAYNPACIKIFNRKWHLNNNLNWKIGVYIRYMPLKAQSLKRRSIVDWCKTLRDSFHLL